MSDPNNSQDNQNVGVSVSQPEGTSTGTKGQRTRRLMAAFNEAAKEVSGKDVNDSKKLEWLLSKLELDQDEKDGLIELLHEKAADRDADQALGEWKLVVITAWSESDKLAKEEEQEAQERER